MITAYPHHEAAIRATLAPRGAEVLFKVQDLCVAETISKFMFRHLQPYFNQDIQLDGQEPFKSLFEEQELGWSKPNAPVLIAGVDQCQQIRSARAVGARDAARPGLVCAGADVEARTNEHPRSCTRR